jgi:hypothetical protein
VDPRAGLDDMEKKKFLTLPGLELRLLGRPARSQSLYLLRYPGSLHSRIFVENYKSYFSSHPTPMISSPMPAYGEEVPILTVIGTSKHFHHKRDFNYYYFSSLHGKMKTGGWSIINISTWPRFVFCLLLFQYSKQKGNKY